MSRLGCINCSHIHYDDGNKIYFCYKEKQIDPAVFCRVWSDEEDWGRDDEPVCPEYKECGDDEQDCCIEFSEV